VALGVGLCVSSVIGALVGVGLRPLCVGQLFGEDEAGVGGDVEGALVGIGLRPLCVGVVLWG